MRHCLLTLGVFKGPYNPRQKRNHGSWVDGEIGEEEGEEGAIGDAKVGGDRDKESAEKGGKIKVAVRRNVLTPLNINLMLQNINNDEILKLLVKRNEDTDGTEPNLDIDLIVRCFFAVVLDRLLLPQATFYLSSATLKAVTDLDRLKTVDWSLLIFENLKSSVAEFGKDKKKLISGCTAVLMVSTNGHNF